jgi:hypothetical protein
MYQRFDKLFFTNSYTIEQPLNGTFYSITTKLPNNKSLESRLQAADVNDDGISDLILGAYGVSKVYVLFGAAGTGVRASTPALAWLGNASPNPFGETTRIDYSLTRESRISIEVFDVRGRFVRVLKESSLTPIGTSTVHWNGRNDRGRRVPAGVYFVKIRAGAEAQTRKVVLVR